MKKMLVFVAFVSTLLAQAQTNSTAVASTELHLVKDYPEGVYLTFEDFLAKKVSPLPKLERRYMPGTRRIHRDTIVDHVFFYNVPDFNKYSDAAAICENGQLYVRQREISKFTKKGDRRYDSENPRTYHRVISDGKFFYFEGPFSNMWKKGLAAGFGDSMAVSNIMREHRGLVFDFSENTFDIFIDCDDFKKFLKEQKINEAFFCQQFSLKEVRRVIEKLNK